MSRQSFFIPIIVTGCIARVSNLSHTLVERFSAVSCPARLTTIGMAISPSPYYVDLLFIRIPRYKGHYCHSVRKFQNAFFSTLGQIPVDEVPTQENVYRRDKQSWAG